MSAKPSKDTAISIVQRLKDSGHEALLAGGCVRDMLLNIEPKDYDVATSAAPDEVMALFERVIPVGAAFGVVLVVIDGTGYEVATFRQDQAYRDGRHPEGVIFSDARHDAERRDFTINGLFFDPEKNEIVDHVGGRDDLDGRIIRAIGNPVERFAEDRLRMLRAVRFATRFDYEIEQGTARAITDSAEHITEVSWERIRDEIVGMFTGPRAGQALQILDDLGLLSEILPEVAAMKGVSQPEQFHPEGDVFEHTKMMLDEMENPPPRLAMAVLLHDVGKPPTFQEADRIRFHEHDHVGAEMAGAICQRLRFSTADIEAIQNLVDQHMRFINVRRMKTSTLKRFVRMDGFEDHLELHRLDCLASHGGMDNYEYARQKFDELEEDEVRPPRLVTGADLIEMGYERGPVFREILDAVEEEQLEGRLVDREDALRWVRSRFPRNMR
jgi:poly(A) polymerase